MPPIRRPDLAHPDGDRTAIFVSRAITQVLDELGGYKDEGGEAGLDLRDLSCR